MIKKSLSYIRHMNFWIILRLHIIETRNNFEAIFCHTRVAKNPVAQRHLTVAAYTLIDRIQILVNSL